MDRKSKKLGFSESLERDLSNGTIKVDIREVKIFAKFGIEPTHGNAKQLLVN